MAQGNQKLPAPPPIYYTNGLPHIGKHNKNKKPSKY